MTVIPGEYEGETATGTIAIAVNDHFLASGDELLYFPDTPADAYYPFHDWQYNASGKYWVRIKAVSQLVPVGKDIIANSSEAVPDDNRKVTWSRSAEVSGQISLGGEGSASYGDYQGTIAISGSTGVAYALTTEGPS